jgi:outer membrane protein W
LAAAFCTAAFAQQWEIGGFAGYGWYRQATVVAPGATADTGIRNRFAAGAFVDENLYRHFSGELRYVHQDGNPFVTSRGVSTELQGASHTITYDGLFHFRSREQAFRPFVAVGAGVKGYVDTGSVPVSQPGSAIASLTNHDEWTFVGSLGAGMKYLVGKRVLIRADFRDYLTKFPHQLIAPAGRNTTHGIFQQFTPMLGISYGF